MTLTIKSILTEADNLYDLGRSVYKGTPCGPWIRATLHESNWDIEYPDGSYCFGTPSKEKRTIGYQDTEAEYVGQLTAFDVTEDVEIESFEVGSIVEGSDAEVGPYTATTPEQFWELVEQVNQEASALWEEANNEEEED